MYFRAAQYPQLASLRSSERRLVVAAAIREHNTWVGRRLVLAFVAMLITTVGVGFLPASMLVPEWAGTAVAVVDGVLFYLYLLWELNGPILRAVEQHVSSKSVQRPH